MKHLQPYTEFINESQQLPDGVEQLDSQNYFDARRGRSIPLSTEDIEKVESLMKLTGAINRHEHLRNKSTPDNELIICKDKTPYSYIPPIACFGKTDGIYDLTLNIESDLYNKKYYSSPTLEPLIQIALEAFLGSGKFKPQLKWETIK
jgi:hypothetical protein